MKKKKITILIGLIGLAILGLLTIQGLWLNDAYNLKKEQFRQYVYYAITNVTNKIQNKLQSKGTRDTLPYDAQRTFNSGLNNNNFKKARTLNSNNINIRSQVQIIAESGLMFDSVTYKQEFYTEYSDEIPEQSPTNVPQAPEVLTPLNAERNQKIYNNSPKFKLSDYFTNDELRFLISDNLTKSSITLNFEYAVLDNQRNIIMNSDSFKRDTKYNLFAGLINSGSKYSPSNILVLYFPGEKEYLRHSLGFLSTSAIILTIIILLAFGYTLFFIYNQKKIAEIRTDFVNNMTHELKTPISTISLASQMLHDPSIPTESKNVGHLSKVILDESKRLSFQVERVLQTAIFEKGKLNLKIRQLDAHELINNVVRNFIIQVKNRNGQIIKNLDAQYSLVNVDEVHFGNVILNLLDNAIKYCKTQPSISVTTFNKKGNLIIQVADNGIGIKKEDQKRIFEKFYRVPTGNVHNVKGFGLGLSYVKKIVEEHGGKISIESEFNVGTTFEINLPVIKNNG